MYMSCTRHRINKGNCGSFSLSVPLFSLRSVPLFSLWYQSIGLVRETAHCFASANISMTETSSEKYLTETMDFYDPCYIHPSGHTNHDIVTQLLEDDNHATWSRAMMVFLKAKNKLGFIDGMIKAPSEKDPKCSILSTHP